MFKRFPSPLSLLLTAALATPLIGCGEDANGGTDPTNPTDYDLPLLPFDPELAQTEWSEMSAPNIFFNSGMSANMAMLIFHEEDEEEDPDCPAVVETDTKVTITGGCTNIHGVSYEGTMVIEQTAHTPHIGFDFPGPFSAPDMIEELSRTRYRAHNFKVSKTETCENSPETKVDAQYEVHGTIEPRFIDNDNFSFDIDLLFSVKSFDDEADDCSIAEESMHMSYTGSAKIIDSSYDEDAELTLATHHIWSGSGQVIRPGAGILEVKTQDEVFHIDECAHEPYSGKTSVTNADNTIEYRYDGDTDCDEEATISWFIDGEEQGQITDVRCTMAPGAPGTTGLAIIMLMLLRLSTRRRDEAHA